MLRGTEVRHSSGNGERGFRRRAADYVRRPVTIFGGTVLASAAIAVGLPGCGGSSSVHTKDGRNPQKIEQQQLTPSVDQILGRIGLDPGSNRLVIGQEQTQSAAQAAVDAVEHTPIWNLFYGPSGESVGSALTKKLSQPNLANDPSIFSSVDVRPDNYDPGNQLTSYIDLSNDNALTPDINAPSLEVTISPNDTAGINDVMITGYVNNDGSITGVPSTNTAFRDSSSAGSFLQTFMPGEGWIYGGQDKSSGMTPYPWKFSQGDTLMELSPDGSFIWSGKQVASPLNYSNLAKTDGTPAETAAVLGFALATSSNLDSVSSTLTVKRLPFLTSYQKAILQRIIENQANGKVADFPDVSKLRREAKR